MRFFALQAQNDNAEESLLYFIIKTNTPTKLFKAYGKIFVSNFSDKNYNNIKEI